MPLVPQIIIKLDEYNEAPFTVSPLVAPAPDFDFIFPVSDYSLITFNPLGIEFYSQIQNANFNPNTTPFLDPLIDLDITVANGNDGLGAPSWCIVSKEAGKFNYRQYLNDGDPAPVFFTEYQIEFDDVEIEGGAFEICGYGYEGLFLQGTKLNGDFAFVILETQNFPLDYTVITMAGYTAADLDTLYKSIVGADIYYFTILDIAGDYFMATLGPYIPPSGSVLKVNSIAVKDAISLPCYNPCFHYGVKEDYSI